MLVAHECALVDETSTGFSTAGLAGEVAGDGPAAAQPLPRLGSLALALRQSRDALGKLQGELDASWPCCATRPPARTPPPSIA